MTGLENIINLIKKLNNIGRWSNEFLHQRASVAEHSFSVAQIAQMLGIMEEQNGNSVNWKALYQKSLNHDVPEAIIGDVISTTKNATPQTKAALDEVEQTLMDVHLFSKLDLTYRDIYKKIIFDGKDSTLEGEILKAADNIDALFECLSEIKLANEEPFSEKYFMILEKINKSELKSVHIFLDEILPKLIGERCENQLSSKTKTSKSAD